MQVLEDHVSPVPVVPHTMVPVVRHFLVRGERVMQVLGVPVTLVLVVREKTVQMYVNKEWRQIFILGKALYQH